MACINNSLSSLIFVSDLSSYGLIGLISIGLILYFAYIIAFIRNHPFSSVYIYFSQFSLLFLLLSPITFLFRPSVSTDILCPTQTLSFQILPFCLLLGLNVHFISEWLLKLTNSHRQSFLVLISSFLIFFLAILIQTAILLIWFYHNHHSQQLFDLCSDECPRPLFLCSLLFNFLLLFLYSFQSSLKFHWNNIATNFIYLLTSLLALCVTIIWICLYLFLPLNTFSIKENYLLAYGILFFVYTFLAPFLYEQLFYAKENKDRSNQMNRMTFKCLSLTKEQQRAFMAAYIKRNLTASCENLTTKNLCSSTQQSNQTRHSTLSVESLCPTLISTISYEIPPTRVLDTSQSDTMKSEYLLISTAIDMK